MSDPFGLSLPRGLLAVLLLGLPPFLAGAAEPVASPETATQRKAREALQKVYALADDQVLKCFRPPFPPERNVYLLSLGRTKYDVETLIRIQCWKQAGGRLKSWWATYSPETSEDPALLDLMEPLTGIRRCEVEDAGGLLDTKVRADFVILDGAPR